MSLYRLMAVQFTGADRRDRQRFGPGAEVAWSVMAVGRIGTVVTRCREAVDCNAHLSADHIAVHM